MTTSPISQANHSYETRINHYHKAITRYQKLEQRLDKTSARIAVIRFVSFVSAAACTFSAWYDQAWGFYLPWALGAWLIFAIALYYHRKVYYILPRVKMALACQKDALIRIEQRWSDISDDGVRFISTHKPHEKEMLLFGDMSAYKAINATHLKGSQARLAFLLKGGLLYTESNDHQKQSSQQKVDAITQRQQASQCLTTKNNFRTKLSMETRLAAQKGGDLSHFVQWSKSLDDQETPSRLWKLLYVLSPLLVLATCIQGILSIVFGIATLWQLCLLGQLMIFIITTGKLQSHYAPLIQQGHHSLVGLSHAFKVVEKTSFTNQYLQEKQKAWTQGTQTPSQRIAQISKIADALAVRHSALLYSILAIVFLWEVRYAFQAWIWRSEHGVHVAQDLKQLYDWEALASIATYTLDHPDHQWSHIHTDANQPVIRAEAIAHPLFARSTRKPNDFVLQQKGHLWLITGSNMSGKSSFLRTLGLNAHLAFAGVPTCAHQFAITPLCIASSVQITDDPSQGWSRFYAEVKRIRSVIESAEEATQELPILYLVDEMLSGTNSKERRLASRRIAQRLLQAPHAFGLITTHDLDLAHLIDHHPEYMFAAHFSDHFDGETLHFDYQLKSGVAQTTNALHVLQLEGIYVPQE